MAIKPPSDIVLDVVRAADPVRRQAAVDKLTGARATDAPRREFASLVGDAEPASRAGACGGPASRSAAGKVPDAYKSFEAFFIQSFVQSMLPKGSDASYGSGTAGDIWRSELAEQIGKEIADSGGIGIAARLMAQKAKAEAAGQLDDSTSGFSLSDQISKAAPFGGWASYLPFLEGRAAAADPSEAAGDQSLPTDDV